MSAEAQVIRFFNLLQGLHLFNAGVISSSRDLMLKRSFFGGYISPADIMIIRAEAQRL